MDCGNFSESAQNLWDFTRCQRADGSYYGTSGKCRSGNEVGAKLAKLPVEKLQKLAANPRLSSTQKKQVQTAISEKGGAAPVKAAAKEPAKPKADAKPESADGKAKKVEDLKKAHLAYTDALKKQMELVAKGDMAGAEKMGVKVKAAIAKVKKAEEAKKTPEEKAAERKYADERVAMMKKQEKRDAAQDNTKLNAAQKKALKDYTKEGEGGKSRRSYDDVNKCLRDPSSCKSEAESLKFAKDLDGALKALPSNDAGDSFYRGVSASKGAAAQLYSALENAKPGTVLKDPGFGSYSADRRQAENFTNNLTPTSKNIMFVSRNRSMTPINRFSDIPSENEAILPRGSSQTIRSVTKKGGTLIVELD